MNILQVDHETIVTWARGEPKIRRVWLYGSRARGDHRPDSDVDLAIEMDFDDPTEARAEWIHWIKEFRRYARLKLKEHTLHPQFYHPDADLDRVGPGVENDGILLFDRTQE